MGLCQAAHAVFSPVSHARIILGANNMKRNERKITTDRLHGHSVKENALFSRKMKYLDQSILVKSQNRKECTDSEKAAQNKERRSLLSTLPYEKITLCSN